MSRGMNWDQVNYFFIPYQTGHWTPARRNPTPIQAQYLIFPIFFKTEDIIHMNDTDITIGHWVIVFRIRTKNNNENHFTHTFYFIDTYNFDITSEKMKKVFSQTPIFQHTDTKKVLWIRIPTFQQKRLECGIRVCHNIATIVQHIEHNKLDLLETNLAHFPTILPISFQYYNFTLTSSVHINSRIWLHQCLLQQTVLSPKLLFSTYTLTSFQHNDFSTNNNNTNSFDENNKSPQSQSDINQPKRKLKRSKAEKQRLQRKNELRYSAQA